MLDHLRLPFFIIAAIVIIVVIGVELGSALITGEFNPGLMRSEASRQLAGSDMSDDDRNDMVNKLVREGANATKPPGMAIGYMALLDGLVFFAVLLMGASLIIPEAVHGKIQGIITLIVSILVLLAAIAMFFKAFIEVTIMVGLFLAAPFGTLAYLAVWGFFNRGGASAILAISMFLKLVFVILLVLAHQRFLQNKGLVLLTLTTLLANFLIAFLHGFVPIILVSITDGVAAIIVAIFIGLWSIFLLIGAIFSVVKAIL